MARDATSPIKTRSPWRRLPALIALAAAFNEMGINSAAAATVVTLAVPVTATVFVYEVSALRDAQLEREALDRARHDGAAASQRSPLGGSEETAAKPAEDVAERLDAMLVSRSALLDTFGDDAAAVAPVYTRIIRHMLKEDDDTFAQLRAKRASQAAPAPLIQKENSLRAAHQRLARLVGS